MMALVHNTLDLDLDISCCCWRPSVSRDNGALRQESVCSLVALLAVAVQAKSGSPGSVAENKGHQISVPILSTSVFVILFSSLNLSVKK